MFKKLFVSAALLAALGTFVFGRDVVSVVKTAGRSVKESVKSEVSLDFELDRARGMLAGLDPEIRSCMSQIAEQQVDIELLEKESVEKKVALEAQQRVLMTLRSDLDNNLKEYVYSGISYPEEEVRADLKTQFSAYKNAAVALERDQNILQARKKTLQANRSKLEKMVAAKKELEVQIAEMEAKLRTLEAAEAVKRLECDDTSLARTQKVIDEIDRKIAIRKKMLDEEAQFTGMIKVDAGHGFEKDLLDEIDAYFEPASKERSVPVSPSEALTATQREL